MPGLSNVPVAVELARFVAGVREGGVPDSALEMARHCVLDLMGAAAAGFGDPAAAAAREFGAAFFPGGKASVWFHGAGLSPAGAAMVNSTAASILDLDDGNRSAGGHPGASIIPACLAMAEPLGKSGGEFLTALAIGYEIAVRVSAARNLSALDTFSTGRWCGYGAVAAAGRLAGYGADRIANSMAIAGIHAPLQSASGYSQLEHSTKEGIPWATLTGLAALDLAGCGYTGPLDILDHPDYFDREKILGGLGREWAIEQTYFKPYSCCRWIHAALDALSGLMAEHGLAASDITEMEVHTFARAKGLKNQLAPETIYGAQFSVPYCLALSAVKGVRALQPLTRASVGLGEVSELASRVKLAVDPELESWFPGRAAARLTVRTAGGVFTRQVDHPLGDAANPMSLEKLEQKFDSLGAKLLTKGARGRILDAVNCLKTGDLKPLIKALKAPSA